MQRRGTIKFTRMRNNLLFHLETNWTPAYLLLGAAITSPFRDRALARFGALLPEPWPPRAISTRWFFIRLLPLGRSRQIPSIASRKSWRTAAVPPEARLLAGEGRGRGIGFDRSRSESRECLVGGSHDDQGCSRRHKERCERRETLPGLPPVRSCHRESRWRYCQSDRPPRLPEDARAIRA